MVKKVERVLKVQNVQSVENVLKVQRVQIPFALSSLPSANKPGGRHNYSDGCVSPSGKKFVRVEKVQKVEISSKPGGRYNDSDGCVSPSGKKVERVETVQKVEISSKPRGRYNDSDGCVSPSEIFKSGVISTFKTLTFEITFWAFMTRDDF